MPNPNNKSHNKDTHNKVSTHKNTFYWLYYLYR